MLVGGTGADGVVDNVSNGVGRHVWVHAQVVEAVDIDVDTDVGVCVAVGASVCVAVCVNSEVWVCSCVAVQVEVGLGVQVREAVCVGGDSSVHDEEAVAVREGGDVAVCR